MGLSAKQVQNEKPDLAKVKELPDGDGLYLVIQRSGTKSWAFRYRLDGRSYNMTLGRVARMTLAEARVVATDLLKKVTAGVNPMAERKAEKEAKADAEADRRFKLDKLLGDFAADKPERGRTREQTKGFIDRLVARSWEVKGVKHPGWADRDVPTITKDEIKALVAAVRRTGRETTGNRVLACMRAFLNWCVDDAGIMLISPLHGHKQPKEEGRERFLIDSEIRLFWRACDEIGRPFGHLFKFMLLTGQRRGEAAEMTEGEIHGNEWHLGGARTKNGQSHLVPLSPAALAVLDSVVRPVGRRKAPYIFTTTGDTPVSGFSKAHAAVHAKMVQLAEAEGLPFEIKPWRLHDLRRTCSTNMARLGVSVAVTEAVINHSSGSRAGIVKVYQKYEYAREKREALELWAHAVADIVEGLEPVAEIERRAEESRRLEIERAVAARLEAVA